MVALKTRLELCAAGTAILSAILVFKSYHSWTRGDLSSVLYGLWGTVFTLCSVVLWDISSLDPADSHGFKSLLTQYVLIRLFSLMGPVKFKQFVKQSKQVKELQQSILLKSLSVNKNCQYGRLHKFGDVCDMETFKSIVPLITYTDVKPYIDLEAQGCKGELTSHQVVFLSLSSGTTGYSKLVPIVKSSKGRFALASLTLGSALSRCKMDLGRVLGLRFKSNDNYSSGGIRISTLSALHSPYHPHFLSPKPAYGIKVPKISHYVHAVFGLRDRQISSIDGLTMNIVLDFFTTLETSWEDICNDITRGRLSDDLDIPADLKQTLNKHLQPDQERGAELAAMFRKGFIGIGKRIWPKLKSVWGYATGSYAIPAKVLADVYLKGVYQQSNTHSACEGMLGVNMAAEQEGQGYIYYTFVPFFTFYEFIPVDQITQDKPDTLFLHQLEKDQLYEIVISNLTTLYRYRTGDVIKVVDFLNQCPVYQFQYRQGQLLNLYFEGTTEKQMEAAVLAVMATLPRNVVLLNYTTTDSSVLAETPEDVRKNLWIPLKSYYVLFVDIAQDGRPYKISEQQAEMFDDELKKANNVYGIRREDGRFSALIVHQVAPGAFDALKEHITSLTNTPQYKTPRVLRSHERLKILLQ